MRILIINQFFWPDVAPTGQYLADLTRHLAEEGHDVTVICAKDPYGQIEDDGQAPPPVRVIRVAGVPFKRSMFSRLLSYFTFITGAFWHGLRVARPDMVVTMTTPPLLSVVGAFVKTIRGSRHFIWEMDVFPDVLVTTGVMAEGSRVIKILRSIQSAARRHADGIIALGPCMRDRLVADGTPANLISVAENWADGRVISSRPHQSSDRLHVLYSGNLGRAHDIGTIADAMRYFRNDPRFLFTFAGAGVGRARLKQVCETEAIRNVRFPAFAGRADMSDHLAQADIGLVTELPACIGTVVPSKVYGLMAAGRPILFIGPPAATPSLLIQEFQCGWQVTPGDSSELIALLEHLFVHREQVWFRGENALSAFRQGYDLPQGVARVTAALGLKASNVAAVKDVVASETNLDSTDLGRNFSSSAIES